MNILFQAVNGLRRDWRAGELKLIASAIIIAVASLTTVNFFTDRVQQATEIQATELLAADLVVLSSTPISQSLIDKAEALGLISTNTTSFRSMVVAEDKLKMAEVKAVESGYPIRGALRTSDILFGPEQIPSGLPLPGKVWVDARLLQNLGINLGEIIKLGKSQLVVSKILNYEPDRGGDIFNIAPRLLMNAVDVEETGLILPGSRVQYRLLLGGDNTLISKFRAEIEDQDKLRIQGIRDARPELKSALERAEQFLGLAALVSIALAGLAVAMSAQRYAGRHFDTCAIMRCLGAEQHTITQIFFLQLLILSLISSLIGVGIAFFAQQGLSTLMTGLTNNVLPAASLLPVVMGLIAGIATVLGFAMPQLLRLRQVSPLRVIRRDLTPLPLSGFSSYGAAIITLALLTPWQSGSAQMTLFTFVGILATALLLVIFSKLIIHYLNKLRSRVGVAWRYGLSNVARRANLSLAQILGIGLGIMIMLLLTLIRTDLLESWRNRLPEGTPNYFLINIQPDEVSALNSFLQERAELSADIYPMIRGRLVAINDKAVSSDDYTDQRAQRLVNREFNLSIAENMQADNRLEAGVWWSESETDAVFSVEEGIAESLGIALNDSLTYSIGGLEVTGRVSNLRWVEWDSFRVNFFVIANPGTLDHYPATFITSFFLPADNRHLLNDLVKAFPSVTVFDIDALLSQVRIIMEQVIKTVEFVFGFTLIAGILVMLAALQTTHDERSYESALLSSLGANRKQILASLAAEFITLGLIAGVLAAFAASAVELLLAEFVLKIDVAINPWVWIIAPVVSTLVIVAGGLIGTRKVLNTPPMLVLRKL
ncbi:MAG: FtsX-like permease family protein [Gammaproteobacteria bacterium]|jgi:putative ABC transport system permease protein|nr:FtsX-like permease family protein [Gammaproteobacteria bacterium]